MEFSPAAHKPVVAAQNASMHFADGEQIDDFCIIGELGTGAFARVYLAQQVSLQRLLSPDRAPDIRPQLSLFGRWVDRYSTLLKLAPLFAVMRLSLYDDTHWASVLVLSLFGLACIGFAIAIAPRIGRMLKTLHIAETPTEEFKSTDPVTSHASR